MAQGEVLVIVMVVMAKGAQVVQEEQQLQVMLPPNLAVMVVLEAQAIQEVQAAALAASAAMAIAAIIIARNIMILAKEAYNVQPGVLKAAATALQIAARAVAQVQRLHHFHLHV